MNKSQTSQQYVPSGDERLVLRHFRKYAQKLNEKCVLGCIKSNADAEWVTNQMMRAAIIEGLCCEVEAGKHREDPP